MISSLRKMNQITSIPNVTEKGKIKIKRKDRRKRGKCCGRASRLSSDSRFSLKARSREQSVPDRFPLLLLVVYSFTFFFLPFLIHLACHIHVFTHVLLLSLPLFSELYHRYVLFKLSQRIRRPTVHRLSLFVKPL